MLTAIAMYVTLQGAQRDYEATLGAMHDVLPEPLFEFMAGRASDWESPIVGPNVSGAADSGPRRRRRARRHTVEPAPRGIGVGKDLAIRAARRPAPRRLAALVGAAAARGRRHARQQQLGGVGRPFGDRQRHRRQRHAPAAVGAEHLVPGRLRISRRATPRRDPPAGRGDAARRPADGRRQQRRHRLGLHQLGRRLVGPGRRRPGARRPDAVPDTGRGSRLRPPPGVDCREGRGPGACRSALDDLGTGRWRRPSAAAAWPSSGWRTIPGCWPPTRPGSPRPATWTRRCACRWARRWRPRTWWSAIAVAGSPGRSTGPSRSASASAATCRPRGRTARGGGTAT